MPLRPHLPPDLAPRAAFWGLSLLLDVIAFGLLLSVNDGEETPAFVARQHVAIHLVQIALTCLFLAFVGPFRRPPARLADERDEQEVT